MQLLCSAEVLGDDQVRQVPQIQVMEKKNLHHFLLSCTTAASASLSSEPCNSFNKPLCQAREGARGAGPWS